MCLDDMWTHRTRPHPLILIFMTPASTPMSPSHFSIEGIRLKCAERFFFFKISLLSIILNTSFLKRYDSQELSISFDKNVYPNKPYRNTPHKKSRNIFSLLKNAPVKLPSVSMKRFGFSWATGNFWRNTRLSCRCRDVRHDYL